jgi:hypothetical protein
VNRLYSLLDDDDDDDDDDDNNNNNNNNNNNLSVGQSLEPLESNSVTHCPYYCFLPNYTVRLFTTFMLL